MLTMHGRTREMANKWRQEQYTSTRYLDFGPIKHLRGMIQEHCASTLSFFIIAVTILPQYC